AGRRERDPVLAAQPRALSQAAPEGPRQPDADSADGPSGSPDCPGRADVGGDGRRPRDGIRIQLDGAAEVPKENILVEPVARNTAAAIGWAAEALRRLDPDGVMLVMPADHVIPDEAKFLRVVALAVEVAQAGKLVTFGIRPTR